MHALVVDALVEPFHAFRWYALAEVSLDTVDADIAELLDAGLIPLHGSGVREVDEGHARLPEVPLPDIAVRAAHEVAIVGGELEDRGCLADVRVCPYADLVDEAGFFQAFDLAGWVGELVGVEDEVTPVEGAEPEAVEVEYFDGDGALFHFGEEVGNGCFGVGGCEGGGKPETE
jgi:hypothetical protein